MLNPERQKKLETKFLKKTPDSKQMKPSGSKKEGKCGEETRLFTISGFCSHEKARGYM